MRTFSDVALFTRAWIEIYKPVYNVVNWKVALFTRAWIEIVYKGLSLYIFLVALFTRAWIEIQKNKGSGIFHRRPLHEGVD